MTSGSKPLQVAGGYNSGRVAARCDAHYIPLGRHLDQPQVQPSYDSFDNIKVRHSNTTSNNLKSFVCIRFSSPKLLLRKSMFGQRSRSSAQAKHS